MSKRSSQPSRKAAQQKETEPPVRHKQWRLPVLLLFFVAVLVWATYYYGSVFQLSREYSFWVSDTRQLDFILSCSFGILRYVGRALLMTYKYPWLGGLLMAFILTLGTWLVGYCWRLKAKWRALQYLPALAYMGTVTYYGLDIFFEAETGYIMGIPFLVLLVLVIWGIMIRSFSRKKTPSFIKVPSDETHRDNLIQLVVCVLGFAAIVGFNELKRPYVRVITQLALMEQEQDWEGIQALARANAYQSNRPMACMYAIALVHTDQIAERMYDIRLDYDSLYLHGMDKTLNNGSSMYIAEGCYHGGFPESCMHSCMEQMVMQGPTLRLMKLYIKSALMRGEWELCRKFLRILSDVPFEGSFCKKYGAMVGNDSLVDADPEIAKIRLTEPLHDSFEGMYQQPVFMGYNLALVEGRSANALYNSLCVCLYTKLMPSFLERLEPLMGRTPPDIIADGILLTATKNPGLENKFTGLNLRIPRIQGFMQQIQPYMSDRPGHAYELFGKYKGYYPYYYFFGNLKATKKGYTGEVTSNSGVN
ncbi:MAG: hypothetical protein IKO73_01620 [Bacteroidaceae bacterium]|nr:hypothetical protein [Bacteroidaceae bacterium]